MTVFEAAAVVLALLFRALAVPAFLVILGVVAVSMALQPFDPSYGVLTAMMLTARGEL